MEANVDTLPDTQVEAMTQEAVRVHEDNTDRTASKECELSCQDGPLDEKFYLKIKSEI